MSLSLFFERHSLEIDHEVACAATCFWAQSVWTVQWQEHVRENMEKACVGSYVVGESQRTSRSVLLWTIGLWYDAPKEAGFWVGRWQTDEWAKILAQKMS